MADAPKPTNRDILTDINILLDDVVKDIKTIKDDVHYIKIAILSGKLKQIEQQKHQDDQIQKGWGLGWF